MPELAATEVRFDGMSGPLHGKVTRPERGKPRAALVLAHGRHGTMDEPLTLALAELAPRLGLWSLRFNFAFRDQDTEPSAGMEDEIADLREALAFSRRASEVDRVIVAGRGLGAWAAVAAATDEDAEDAILLGLSYSGQPERRLALERLHEFEIATLVLVGERSERADAGALRDLFRAMPTVRLEVVPGADHRLRDPRGRTIVDEVSRHVERWIRDRLG